MFRVTIYNYHKYLQKNYLNGVFYIYSTLSTNGSFLYLQALEAKMKSEKQFNRKVELNARRREIQERLRSLAVPC